jgi:CRP-like cAMP-binding protein
MSVGLDARVALLHKVWLFDACTEDELAHIAGLVHPRTVDKDTAVIAEGEAGSEFFVIVKGTASATTGGDKLEDLEEGGFFGEISLLDGGERLATVTATSKLDLLVLDRHDFNEMLEAAMPEVTPKLLQVVGERMRALAQHDGKPTIGF